METGSSITAIVNTLGHLTALVLFAAFLWFIVRDPERPRRPGYGLAAGSAAMALCWNAASLAVLALPSATGDTQDIAAAVGFVALSLMPAFLLHLALREAAPRSVAAWLRWGGYLVSVVAVGAHLRELGGGDAASHQFGLWVITCGFGALSVAAAVVLGRSGKRESMWVRGPAAIALLLLSVSFAHFGGEHAADLWARELAFHHAALPLALYVLLQDYRFLLLDVFVRAAVNFVAAGFLSMAAVLAWRWSLGYRSGPDGFSNAVLISGLTALLLGFAALRGWFHPTLEKVLFRRSDREGVLRKIRQAAEESTADEEFLHAASEAVARSVQATRWVLVAGASDLGAASPVRVQSEGQPMDDESTQWVRTVVEIEPSTLRLLLGPRKAGRRYWSGDIEEVTVLAHEIQRQLEMRKRQEVERRAARSELEALRAQINPHFLFNALNALYASIPRSAAQARRALLGLAETLRYSIDRASHYVTVAEEVQVVEAYLAIERLRLGGRLRTDLDIEEGARGIKIPALTLQPLVENAVRHGAAALPQGCCVRVEVRRKGERIEVAVGDDGPGFGDGCEAAGGQEARDGQGLANVRRRLELCYGSDAELVVETSSTGSLVQFSAPAQ